MSPGLIGGYGSATLPSHFLMYASASVKETSVQLVRYLLYSLRLYLGNMTEVVAAP